MEAEPAGFNWVRAWDLAASHGKGDFTAGLKLGIGPAKHLVIGDVVRLRGGPDEVGKGAEGDGATRWGSYNCRVAAGPLDRPGRRRLRS